MLRFGNISFDSILWFCASGQSFFWGLLFLIMSAIIPPKSKWTKYTLYLLRIFGLLLVLLSATPLHPFIYVSILILMIACCFKSKKQIIFKSLFIVFALSAIILELPFHGVPKIATNNINCIYVIGDSVSAGMGSKGEQTWPVLLEEQIGIHIINLANAGATVESALKQASLISDENSIIILEIGGNDLLGYTSPAAFERSCDALLEKISFCKQIVWLELPLLPQHYPYGRIQRKLAKQHNIVLAPKSVLANVFGTENATSDGIHLTQKGHAVMASEILHLFQEIEGRP